MRNKRSELSRRNFLKIGGGAFASAYLLGLAGCGGGEDEANDAQLRMTWWGAQERHERTQRALELFQKENPEINVSTQFTDWEGYWDQLATQTAGGNAPDLIQMSVNYIAEYAGRDALLELEQFIPDIINLSEFDEASLASGRVNDELFGITLGDNAHILLYDTAVLDEVGVEEQNYDWTWEEFTELANEISQATGGDIYGTQDLARDESSFEVFVRQRGKELYTEEGQLGIDKEDLAEWWTYWEALRTSGAAPPAELTAETTVDDIENSLVARGLVAIGRTWSNLFETFQSSTGRSLEISAYPNRDTDSRHGEYVRASQLICGYSGTNRSEEVAAVIDFLLNVPEAIETLESERGVPGSSEAREILRPELPEAKQKELDYVEFISENSTPMTIPRPQASGEIAQNLFVRLSENVSFEQMSIDQAVDEFFSEAEGMLG